MDEDNLFRLCLSVGSTLLNRKAAKHSVVESGLSDDLHELL